jgi:two-component system sensor histidine kinase/response regulator
VTSFSGSGASLKAVFTAVLYLSVFLGSLELAQGQKKTTRVQVTPQNVAVLVDSLNEKAFNLKRQDVSQALLLLQEALELSRENKYLKGEATCYLYEAGIYQQNGYSKRALGLYSKSLEISQALQDTCSITQAKQQMGNARRDAGQLPAAEEMYRETLENYLLLKRSDDVVNVKNNLGRLKLEQKDFVAAEKFFAQALQESQEHAYPYGVKKSQYNLGLLAFERGQLETTKKHLHISLGLDNENQ